MFENKSTGGSVFSIDLRLLSYGSRLLIEDEQEVLQCNCTFKSYEKKSFHNIIFSSMLVFSYS